jgi:hypothetical protein
MPSEAQTMVLNGISIVTTTWNERENIAKLVSMTRNVLQQILHEIIPSMIVLQMAPFKLPVAWQM